MPEAKVYVKFPKAGLGNMLLTWSRAYVFSQLNDLEMHTSSWTAIHLGALIRRERKKRFYFGYFKEANLFKKIRFGYYFKTKKEIIEPPVEQLSVINNNDLFLFNKLFTDYDFFKEVRPYKEMVKRGMFEMLQPSLMKQYERYEKPVIGMHIRRGDFKRGSTITPLSFFIDVINTLRKEAGFALPVTVFTDASSLEIEELTRLNNISIAEPKPDIIDILLLASSKIVVLSIGSTFSYWAAFLCEGVIIKNEVEWHLPFRKENDINYDSEIKWHAKTDVLKYYNPGIPAAT